MTKSFTSAARLAAIVTLTGSVMLAGTVLAAPSDPTAPAGPPNSTVNINNQDDMTGSTPDTSSGVAPDAMSDTSSSSSTGMTHSSHPMASGSHMHDMAAHSPEDMKKHVEMRIKMLHDRLMITKDQEAAWNDVANAMRDNETQLSGLIADRQKNTGTMTAVEDMQSYQKIAQAHADGIGKVIGPFTTLYNSMSDAQKKNADKVFGHQGMQGKMHHKSMTK